MWRFVLSICGRFLRQKRVMRVSTPSPWTITPPPTTLRQFLPPDYPGAAIDTAAAGVSRIFPQALREVCQSLAYQVAADGEGATKVVRIREVTGAKPEETAKTMARAIANSPLVKTAMHGNDPNWGRIVSAAGYSGAPFNPERSTLILQGVPVFRLGLPVKFNRGKLSQSLAAKEVRVELRCGQGHGAASVWTCDLSKDYITINADYHT